MRVDSDYMVKKEIVFDELDVKDLIYFLTLLKESKELDKYENGYKSYGQIENWIKILRGNSKGK